MSFDEFRRLACSRVVFMSILIFAVIGAGISYGLLISYKSRSVVSFEASIPEFRTLQEQLSSLDVFDRYVLGDKAVLDTSADVRGHIVNSDN